MKPASGSSPASIQTLAERQQRFRDLIIESGPLQTRQREIGVEQIQLGFEINLEIAKRAFPNAAVIEAGPVSQGSVLPEGMVHSPHDIPRMQNADPHLIHWCLATLVPVDAGQAAETICQYLIDAKVEPTHIRTQRGALRVLLVR